MEFTKLQIMNGSKHIHVNIPKKDNENYKKFEPTFNFTKSEPVIKKCATFAYESVVQKINPDTSFGGCYSRSKIKKFVDIFSGKYSECALYAYFKRNDISVSEPDFKIYPIGVFEDLDFLIEKDIKVSVKSSKNIAQTLLLEKNRYGKNGEYLEISHLNKDKKSNIYDAIFFVRLSGILELENYLNAIKYDFKSLDDLLDIVDKKYEIELCGYLDTNMFLELITNKQYLPKGCIFGNTTLQVDNYYILIKDLLPIKNFINEIQLKKMKI